MPVHIVPRTTLPHTIMLMQLGLPRLQVQVSDHAFQAVVTYIHVFIVQHLDMIAMASLVKNH